MNFLSPVLRKKRFVAALDCVVASLLQFIVFGRLIANYRDFWINFNREIRRMRIYFEDLYWENIFWLFKSISLKRLENLRTMWLSWAYQCGPVDQKSYWQKCKTAVPVVFPRFRELGSYGDGLLALLLIQWWIDHVILLRKELCAANLVAVRSYGLLVQRQRRFRFVRLGVKFCLILVLRYSQNVYSETTWYALILRRVVGASELLYVSPGKSQVWSNWWMIFWEAFHRQGSGLFQTRYVGIVAMADIEENRLVHV